MLQGGAHAVMATSAGLLGEALLGVEVGAAKQLVQPLRFAASPLFLCVVGLSAAIAKAASGALSVYGQRRLSFQVGDAVRRDVIEEILRVGEASRSVAGTNAALAIRVRDVERGVDEGLLASYRAWTHLLPLGGFLIFLSPKLALGACAALVPFSLLLRRARRRLRGTHSKASTLAERLHGAVDEVVRHLDLWRTYGALGRVRGALTSLGNEAGRVAARADASKAALSGTNEALAAAALLVAVLLVEHAGIQVAKGSLVAFVTVFFMMYRPLRDLGDAATAIDRGSRALDDLHLVHAGAPKPNQPDHAEPPPFVARGSNSFDAPTESDWSLASLQVRGLAVQYDTHRTTAVNLDADPGELVMVVGPTGTGKSSFFRALLGLERNITGSVRYGAQDLTRAGVGPHERPFAWVPQEPALIGGDLVENVTLGASSPEEASPRARTALATLGAEALLERRTGPLVSGGTELSGGERQWVALARALASRLPVLLLDEPTSGLDAASQARVLDALATLKGKRTVLFVTHRPEPLAFADRVIRLSPTSSEEAQPEAP